MKNSMYKKANGILLSVLLCITVFLCLPIYERTYALTNEGYNLAYKIGEKGNGSQLDEIYNDKYKAFSAQLLKEILAKSTGIADADIEDVKQYIKTNGTEDYETYGKNSPVLNHELKPYYVVPASAINTNVNNDCGIVVRLGGVVWNAVSLTLADIEEETDDVILTLYATEWSAPVTNFYGTIASPGVVGSVYASSVLRSNLLTSNTFFSGRDDSGFAQEYLVQPKYIEYQQTQTAIGRGYDSKYNNHMPNEALSGFSTGWNQSTQNWAQKMNFQPAQIYNGVRYDAWGEDYIWIPSVSEVGGSIGSSVTDSIWKLSDRQRQWGSLSSIEHRWLRANRPESHGTINTVRGDGYLSTQGNSKKNGYVPAVHLNLTKAMSNVQFKADAPTDVTAEYDGEILNMEDVPAETKTWYDAEKINLTLYDGDGSTVAGYTDPGVYRARAEIKSEFADTIVFGGTPDTGDPEHEETEYTRWFYYTVAKKKIGVTLTADSVGMPIGAFRNLDDSVGGTGIYAGDTADNGRAPLLGFKYKGRGDTGYAESTLPPSGQGTYTATAYIVNAADVPYELSGGVTMDFEIVKRSPEFSATDIDTVYGAEYAVDTHTTSDGVLSVTYYLANGTTVIPQPPTDAGTYKVKLSTQETATYSAGEKIITIVIAAAKPVVNPIVPEELYYHAGDEMPSIVLSEGDTAGKIQWADGSMPELGKHRYTWEFLPTDTHNYESARGEIQLNFLPVALGSIRVEKFEQGSAPIYAGGDVNALKGMLTVAAYNNDGTKLKVLTDTEYTLSGALNVGTSEITVHYSGFTTTFTVTVAADAIESIRATFVQGDTAVFPTTELGDLKNMLTVTAVYSSGKQEPIADYLLTGTLVAGICEITVDCDGKQTTFSVLVTEVAVKELTATFNQSGNPVFTSASLEDLRAWLVVTAIYNTGEREDIEDYTLTGTLAQGTAVIMVGYGGKTASFTVEVTQVKAISIEVLHETLSVYAGTLLDSLKPYLTVKATYNDGSQNDNVTDYMLAGDLSTAGTKTVIVKYDGLEKSIAVEVSAIAFTDISVQFKQNGKIYAGDDVNDIMRWLTVKAVFSNGTEEIVTDYVLIGSFDRVGETEVTVTYNGKEKTVKVEVSAATVVTKPTVYQASIVYDGQEHGYADFITGFESNIMEFAEPISVIKNAGSYTLKIKIKDAVNVAWDENGDKRVIELRFSIETLKLEYPTNGGSLQYTGAQQTYVPQCVNADFVSLSGNRGTEIDTYHATASLIDKSNTAWLDGSTGDVSFTWHIVKRVLSRPVLTESDLVYTGSEIVVTEILENFDETYMNVSGELKGIDAKVYTLVVSIKDAEHCEWAADAEAYRAAQSNDTEIRIVWEIRKARLAPTWDKRGDTPVLTIPDAYADLVELEYVYYDANGNQVAADALAVGKSYTVVAKLAAGYEGNFEFVDADGNALSIPQQSEPESFEKQDPDAPSAPTVPWEWDNTKNPPEIKLPDDLRDKIHPEYEYKDKDGNIVDKDDLIDGEDYTVTVKIPDAEKDQIIFVDRDGNPIDIDNLPSHAFEKRPDGTDTPPTSGAGLGEPSGKTVLIVIAATQGAMLIVLIAIGAMVNAIRRMRRNRQNQS